MRPLHNRMRRLTLSDAIQSVDDGIHTLIRAEDYLSDSDRLEIVEEVGGHLMAITRAQFPRTNNLEYAILKAHLITEFMLIQFIRCSSQVLVAPESLRFTFAQKLEIALLLGFGAGSGTMVPSLELLNRIRNQATHRFGIDRTLVNQLVRINADESEVVDELTDRQRISFLRHFCYTVCAETAGYLKAIIVMTTRTNTLHGGDGADS